MNYELGIRNKGKLIVILGPTATGKTNLAVKLAKLFNGEIVSADSRQVYKGLDIGTGKDLEEYTIKKAKKQESKKAIPCHLIDVISPEKRFSLAQYQELAYQAIDDIIRRKKTPFLVGGSGLYIQAIVDGYQLADVKPDLKLRAALNRKTLEQLQQLAKKYGIKLNQSDFNNKRRLVRAIEIKEAKKPTASGGVPPKAGKKSNPKYQCLLIGVKYPKEILKQRIEQRLKHRLEKEGLIDEVKRLKKQGLSWKKLDDFGLEYRFVAKYLKGELKYGEMSEKLKTAIGQFAKRQMTWFSAMGRSTSGGKRDKRTKWIKSQVEAEKLIKKFLCL